MLRITCDECINPVILKQYNGIDTTYSIQENEIFIQGSCSETFIRFLFNHFNICEISNKNLTNIKQLEGNNKKNECTSSLLAKHNKKVKKESDMQYRHKKRNFQIYSLDLSDEQLMFSDYYSTRVLYKIAYKIRNKQEQIENLIQYLGVDGNSRAFIYFCEAVKMYKFNMTSDELVNIIQNKYPKSSKTEISICMIHQIKQIEMITGKKIGLIPFIHLAKVLLRKDVFV